MLLFCSDLIEVGKNILPLAHLGCSDVSLDYIFGYLKEVKIVNFSYILDMIYFHF